jgi:hypothetical protein
MVTLSPSLASRLSQFYPGLRQWTWAYDLIRHGLGIYSYAVLTMSSVQPN